MGTNIQKAMLPWRERGGRALDFYWDVFLTRFCSQLPLPLLLLLVVGLLSGRLARDFGLPAVVAYDGEPLKQFGIGVALTLLVLECLFIGFLLQFTHRRPPSSDIAQEPRTFASYGWSILLCFLGTLLAVLVIAIIVRLSARYPHGPRTDETFVGLVAEMLIALQKVLAETAVTGWQVVGAVVTLSAAAAIGHGLEFLARRWGQEPDAVRGRCSWAAKWKERAGDSAERPKGYHWFVIALVAMVAGWYEVTAYFLSLLTPFRWYVNVGVTLASILSLLVVIVGMIVRWPRQAQALLKAVVSDDQILAEMARANRWKALAFVGSGCIVFHILAFAPMIASPVPVVCFLLFLLLAVYGLLASTAHYVLPVVTAGVLALLVVSGMNPYKLRFQALKDYYRGTFTEAEMPAAEVLEAHKKRMGKDCEARLKKRPLDLDAWVEADDTAQQLFNEAVQTGDMAEADRRKEAMRRNRVLPGKDWRTGQTMLSGGQDGLLAVGDINFLTEAERQTNKKKPLVLIAVSGGGIRSAAWTFEVLRQLEMRFAEKQIDFPCHVRVIAGASGGMLGAACYATTLPPKKDRRFDEAFREQRKAYTENLYKEKLTKDCLTSLTRQLVLGDTLLLLSPWPAAYDRGQALEDAWRQNFTAGQEGATSPLDTSFAELREREQSGDIPSLVFSPMLVEDGRRLLISNLDLRYVVSNDGNLLSVSDGKPQVENAPGNYSHEALELFRLIPQAKKTFPVSTAVRMSASFPFFSPAVPLPTVPRRRVVDAGYYDNYGVSLAASWLFSGKHRDWINKNVSKVVLIQIRDGIEERYRRLQEVPEDSSSQVSRAIEELTSPLEGLNEGRIGSSSFRNDGQVELLSAFAGIAFARSQRQGKRVTSQTEQFFTTVIFEYEGPASLSWHLTQKEIVDIDVRAKGSPMREKIDLLLDWWTKP
ncbi:MAG TPA: patatin-like phospholipase family protein [Gemmataceae bacterium]|nr:patatin-like phospholipase family protein [Gemmataceae bacterium]